MAPRREGKGALESPLYDRRKGTKGSRINQGLGPRPGGKLAYTKGSQEKHGTVARPETGIPDKPKHSPAPPVAGSQPSFVASGAPSAVADG